MLLVGLITHVASANTMICAGVHKFEFCTNVGAPSKIWHQNGDVKHVNTEDLQILGATIQNLVATLTCHLGFVHSWISKGKGNGKGKG
jgi:hypothetical protein